MITIVYFFFHQTSRSYQGFTANNRYTVSQNNRSHLIPSPGTIEWYNKHLSPFLLCGKSTCIVSNVHALTQKGTLESLTDVKGQLIFIRGLDAKEQIHYLLNHFY